MDYGATTGHRFNTDVDITGNCEADTYSVGGVAGTDKAITVLDADGTTTHALTFSKGVLTACVTT
jgi:elongation factor P hydroxylase